MEETNNVLEENDNIVVEENDNIEFELINKTQEPPYKFKCLGLHTNDERNGKLPTDNFPFTVGKEYELKEGKFPLNGVKDLFETTNTPHKLDDTEVKLITFDNDCNTPLNSNGTCKIGVRIHKVQGGRRRKSKKSKKSKKTKKTKKSKKSKKTKKSRKH